ncbi:MAG TPA: endopeptidase La, partial [Actinobacteria bacterium]|nr:endopeptidase La [Actinomycetes bacterium]HEX21338.1 endopeptidase La [Actinomycetota bacterium]
RMEVIHFPGYTEEEKVKIAEQFLVPKQLKAHGLEEKNMVIKEDGLRRIVREYTREAGVRNLERRIAAICRQVARKVVEGDKKKIIATKKNIDKFLGLPQFHYGMAEEEDEIGVSTGLAWTEAGGDIISVEASVLKGKGDLMLTGRLGDVMRESAQAGVSYIRSRAKQLGIDEDFNAKTDIHIHIPSGAIPKDGPSAGVTMAAALASALIEKPVKRDVCMTGEITLRGRVLPVGGIKEKILAAHRAGLKKVIMPNDNRKDLEIVPKNVQKDLQFIFVEHMDEVLQASIKNSSLNLRDK